VGGVGWGVVWVEVRGGWGGLGGGSGGGVGDGRVRGWGGGSGYPQSRVNL